MTLKKENYCKYSFYEYHYNLQVELDKSIEINEFTL